MNKYLFGLLAVVFAVTVVAFTKPAPRVDYFFQFDIANFAPTKTNVEDATKWILAPVQDLTTACSIQADQKACKIKVPESATVVVGGIRKLVVVTNDILATQFTPTVSYVSGGVSVSDKRNVQN